MAQQFGLVRVCTFDMIKAEVKNNPELGRELRKYIDSGMLIPDNIVCNMIEKRLAQADCQVNGWVLEGFPHTEVQINLLKSLNIKPTVVFMFNQSEAQSLKNISFRRVDPRTGAHYNLYHIKFNEETLNRQIYDSMGDKGKLQQIGLDKVDPKVLNAMIQDNRDAKLIDFHAFKRLCPPDDDKPEMIKKRFAIWKRTSAMLEDSLTGNVQVVNTDGKGVADVFEELAKVILEKYE